MSGPLEGMLKVVEDHERQQCDAALAHGRQEAARELRDARGDARTRMRRHVHELRQYRDRERIRARAEFSTAERQVYRHRDRELLTQAWPALVEALRGRWAEAGARRRWTDAVFARAKAALRPGLWRVIHPPGWPVPEQQAAAAGLGDIELSADPAIVAGLRVCADGACVDGTLEALLGDRAAVEARLLAGVDDRTEANP